MMVDDVIAMRTSVSVFKRGGSINMTYAEPFEIRGDRRRLGEAKSSTKLKTICRTGDHSSSRLHRTDHGPMTLLVLPSHQMTRPRAAGKSTRRDERLASRTNRRPAVRQRTRTAPAPNITASPPCLISRDNGV